MSARFTSQTSNRQRLFADYDGARQQSQSPTRPSGYGYSTPPAATPSGGAFAAYPGANGHSAPGAQFRSATPNSRGQYSDAVLSELESQNDSMESGLSSKVKKLKDLTLAIGEEIRGSTTLAQGINDDFDSTSAKLKGSMTRMLRMAERTGIGWRIWAGFFAAVIFLFWYVWLF